VNTVRRGSSMGFDDKAENKKDELAGKAKQKAGELTEDERLEAEGRGQKAKGNLKQAGEKVKDAFKE
jgi:uncharacterized protein YjbJ (UPF0337 family)